MHKGVRRIFSQVPETYELVNHVLTLGLDVSWRKRATTIAVDGGGRQWLDVCTGTGETAAGLCRRAPQGTTVHAADFSMPMLRKAMAKPEGCQIQFHIADVMLLPFRNDTFDLITISFATRNINLSRDVLVRTFGEFYRVLRANGRIVHLETSQPSWSPLRVAFHAYVRLLVAPVGRWISGSRAPYTHLASTIPRFYEADTLAEIMHEAGFKDVKIRKLLLGAAAIHRGVKQ